jgi:hypothetical protein
MNFPQTIKTSHLTKAGGGVWLEPPPPLKKKKLEKYLVDPMKSNTSRDSLFSRNQPLKSAAE